MRRRAYGNGCIRGRPMLERTNREASARPHPPLLGVRVVLAHGRPPPDATKCNSNFYLHFVCNTSRSLASLARYSGIPSAHHALTVSFAIGTSSHHQSLDNNGPYKPGPITLSQSGICSVLMQQSVNYMQDSKHVGTTCIRGKLSNAWGPTRLCFQPMA